MYTKDRTSSVFILCIITAQETQNLPVTKIRLLQTVPGSIQLLCNVARKACWGSDQVEQVTVLMIYIRTFG